MRTEENVQIELANERLDRMVTTLHEAVATTAVDASAITAEAERNAMLQIMIEAGLCSKASYIERVAEEVKTAIGDLASNGLINILVDDDDEIVSA